MDEQRLTRLLEAGRSLLAELDLEALLRRLLETGRELTGARYAALGILDERREALERFLAAGVDEEAAEAIGELPRGRGVLGVLIHDPRPLRLADVGTHPASYGFPVGHPPMRGFLGVPVLIGGQPWGNLYLTEGDGEFTAEDEETVVVLAEWAAIGVENARRFGGLRERRDELERSVHALAATTEIANALGGEVALGRIVELIVKRARALIGARAVVLELVEGDELVVAAAAGDIDSRVLGRRAGGGGGEALSGSVLRTQRPHRLADGARAVRFGLADVIDARTALVVPLLFRGRAFGALVAVDRSEGERDYTTDDERVLQAFAVTAAAALATARTAEASGLHRAIAASERERGRWARELHDETLQELGAVRMLLGRAGREAGEGALAEPLRRAVEHVDRSIEGLRALITDLRPAALDALGLAPALEALCARVTSRTPLDVELSLEHLEEGDRRLDPEIESVVYRVVQEALTNAAKHAGATRATVEAREGEVLELRVHDDGAGFDPGPATEGFGLIGMRERVELLGGRFELVTEAGRGTTISARIPLDGRPGAGGGPRSAASGR